MDTSRPQLLMLDLDGCLYRYPDDHKEIFNRARANSGVEISRGTLDPAIACERGRVDFINNGFSYLSLCTEFGISLAEGNMILHRETVFNLQRDKPLIDALKGLDRNRVIPMIVTQSSRCNLDRHLPQIGIEYEISRNMRVTIDDYGYDNLKEKSPIPWLYAKWRAEQVAGFKFDDEDIHVYEDSKNNLKAPHELGWNTVLVHHGNPLPKLLPHLHRQVRTVTDGLLEFPQRAPVTAANDLTAP